MVDSNELTFDDIFCFELGSVTSSKMLVSLGYWQPVDVRDVSVARGHGSRASSAPAARCLVWFVVSEGGDLFAEQPVVLVVPLSPHWRVRKRTRSPEISAR